MVITNNQDIIEDFPIKDRCTTRKRRKNKHKERENMKIYPKYRGVRLELRLIVMENHTSRGYIIAEVDNLVENKVIKLLGDTKNPYNVVVIIRNCSTFGGIYFDKTLTNNTKTRTLKL